MPDAFFASTKTRKRKRTNSQPSSFRGSKKSPGSSRPKPNGKTPAANNKRKALDEELESDRTDEEEGGDIDDLDLERRASEDEVVSGDEDEDETPAQKRLRLAQLYLEDVKEGLGERCRSLSAQCGL